MWLPAVLLAYSFELLLSDAGLSLSYVLASDKTTCIPEDIQNIVALIPGSKGLF
jgi:hypothetical protein